MQNPIEHRVLEIHPGLGFDMALIGKRLFVES